jgi:CBS domain-containing protein
MFSTAGAEFRIAVAGPLVSLLLAGGFLGVALVPGIPVHVDAVCSWLGFTNLVLLLFNLIPALPLDGGRMLRAALWQGTGDLRRATRIAATTGRILAMGLIGLGVLMALSLSVVSGIWLAVIGWFVLQAAGAEGRYVEMQARRAMRVRDMMTTDLVAVDPDETLADVGDRTAGHTGLAAFPVIHDGRVVGILTTADIEAVPRDAWPYHRVADHLTERDHVPTLAADDALDTAVAALTSSHLQRAFILDGERLVGLLSIGDVARVLGVAPPA